MKILIDTREQTPLIFPSVDGVEFERRLVDVGDYACEIDGELIPVRIERKSISDLFTSFSSGYENEKAKILKAKELKVKIILAIEGGVFDVRAGYEYTVGGQTRVSKKDGLSQVKQIYTMLAKGYFDQVWFCGSRQEMSFSVVQYFQALERVKKDSA